MAKRRSRKTRPPISPPAKRTRIALWTIGIAAGCWLAIAVVARLRSTKDLAQGELGSTQTTTEPGQPPTPRTTGDAATRDTSVAEVRLAPSTRPQPTTEADQLAARQDASADDWDTEVLSERVATQLAQLQTLLEQSAEITAEGVHEVATDRVEVGILVPESVDEVLADGPIHIRRATMDPTAATTGAGEGPQALAAELQRLAHQLGPGDERYAKFKVYRIERQSDRLVTQVRYEGSHRSKHEGRQHVANWTCQWTLPPSIESTSLPRLTHIGVASYEEGSIAIDEGRLFTDCTESVLGDNDSYRTQVLPGIPFWLPRLPREFLGQFGHHGLAIGDVNGDQLDDVYVCDAGGLPNRLYLQQTDGTARDVSAEAGVDLLDDSTGALLVDLDNDGDQDLVVATDPTLQIGENDGTAHFRWQPSQDLQTDSMSVSAADYDQDGDLDLYVCGYNVRKQDAATRGLPFPLPYHDANNGGRNVLLRNEGGFRFVDATAETGLEQNNSRFSMAASWEDYDNDGDVDLYVANDFGRNNLYRNERGHFVDVASTAQVEDQASGMSVSWGDADRDGRMDLYVGNMWSSAGNRVTFQDRFRSGIAATTVSHLQRMARGNSLFLNRSTPGNDHFDDVSESAAVELGRWAWASKFIDLTNDGWLDLVVANGYLTNEDKSDL